jgi:nucleoside-diphosphate-sugar epimerase
MIEANVGFTAMVLEAAWRTSAPCIAIAHSSFQHFGERDRALDLYAATKLAAIEIARYYADAHAVSWVGVTLYDVYGPGMTRDTLVTSALKAAAGGPPLATPAEDPVIGLVYVDDAVAAMHAAAESVESGAAPVGTEFFALPMSFLRISEVIDAVERVTGSRVARSDRPYPTPQRAVDRPTIGDPPPGWSATVHLDEGLRRLLAVEG